MPTVTIRQCAVLIGGPETRAGGITDSVPKLLLSRGGRPFLAWLLREFCRFGVTEFLLLAEHGAAAVELALPALRAMLPWPVTISVCRAPAGAGSGGAVFHAAAHLQERFLLCNGDALFDGNLATLLAAAAGDGPEVAGRLLLKQLPDASRSGAVRLEGDRIVAFQPPSPGGAAAIVSTGICVLRRRLLDAVGPVCSFEADIWPALAAAGRMRGTLTEGNFVAVGMPDDGFDTLGERRSLFLDRDGVINVDHGYIGSHERFDWMPGALETIRHATETGWHVFVVTNQSGVARGLYDEAAVRDLLDWMADEVRRHGGTIDDARYCPFHPDAKLAAYRAISDWRKPAPGMLRDLIRAWQLDPARAVLIGDQATDLAAATEVGMAGFLFRGRNLLEFVRPILDRVG